MRRSILFLSLIALAACSRQAPTPAESRTPTVVTRTVFQAGGTTVNLPKAVGPWARPGAPKVVTAETIFDYMDGAGELYVGYRFDHLDVFEYKAADASLGTILVELYSMKHPDDAFGLLSTDWGGEVPSFDVGGAYPSPAFPGQRALYGAGLLRMWSRQLYVRVLAARETPQAREAVLAIGRAIGSEDASLPTGALKTEVRPPAAATPPPPILFALRGSPGDGSVIRPDRTCFFRSHLVLNSAYFLASEDILALGVDVEAVTAEFKAAAGGRATRLVFVRYPSAERARAALQTFTKSYLVEVAGKGPVPDAGAAQLEHGWAGWMLKEQDLAIVLDASSRASARQLAASTIQAAPKPAKGARF